MATEKMLNTRIQLKIDSHENWLTNKAAVLKLGEVGFDIATVDGKSVVLSKVGDGVTTWENLDYTYAKAADVNSYAKQTDANFKTTIENWVTAKVQDTNTTYQIVEGAHTADNYVFKLQSKEINGSWIDAGTFSVPKDKLVEGSANGTVKFNGVDVAVHGLADAAYVTVESLNATAQGYANVAKNEVIGTDTDTATSDTIKGAKKYADSLNTAMDTRVDALEAAIGEGGSVGSQIDAKINALDVADTAVVGKYVSSVSETDGKITVTREDLPDYTDVYEPKGTGATEAGKVQTALDAEVTRAKAAEAANATAASNAQSAADAAQADIDALEAKVGTVPADKTVVEMISDAQTAATYDDTALKARVSANETAITTLNGDATVAGSVKKQVADAVAQIVADAPEAYDTLKEISDWISSHASDASAMNTQINANKTDIATLQTLVGTLPDTASATTVVGYIDEVIDALKIGDYAKAADLNAAIARISTAEGKITTLEGKVSALEAVGAQANVIETVKVNGVALTPDATKAVDVTVPTGALASKDKVAEDDLATALATKINAKAEQSALDELDTYVGTIPETASAKNIVSYIDEKVAAEGVAALKNRVTTAEGEIDDLQADVAILKGADTVEGSVAKAVSDGIAALDVEDTAVAHQVVTAVSETDGKIAVTRAQLSTDDIAAGTEVWVFNCGTSSVNV